MGFAVGPLVLGVGASLLLNQFGWRSTFIILAILYAVLLVVTPLFIASSSKKEVQENHSLSRGSARCV